MVATFIAIAAWTALNPAPVPLTLHDIETAVASALAAETAGPPDSELAYSVV